MHGVHTMTGEGMLQEGDGQEEPADEFGALGERHLHVTVQAI